ncbi:hypothetical protein O9992_19105 [Vibrio lentus]|nr:hypothetical protein [Vibrio lentus]
MAHTLTLLACDGTDGLFPVSTIVTINLRANRRLRKDGFEESLLWVFLMVILPLLLPN